MKFIVVNNSEANGGGYLVRSDECETFIECKRVFQTYANADRYATRLSELDIKCGPLLRGGGWVLKEVRY